MAQNPKIKEITQDGVKLYIGEKEGDIREPRFLMPKKEGYQNSKARVIRRTGHIQSIIEIYVFDTERHFVYFRFNNSEEVTPILDQVQKNAMTAFELTITDILPNDFQEYKANFYKGIWLKPKQESTVSYNPNNL